MNQDTWRLMMKKTIRSFALCCGVVFIGWVAAVANEPLQAPVAPLMRVVDLDIGESSDVELSDGHTATVKIIAVKDRRDSIRKAIRQSLVTVEVNGRTTELVSATYHLPKRFNGVQIDCPITQGYMSDSKQDAWALTKDVRLRLWPADSPWIRPGTFRYPVKQRWFVTNTQMANEPTWVNGGEDPDRKKIYYHNELDIGGAEGMVEVLAATSGLVFSAGTATIDPDRKRLPYTTKYDYVGVLDERGWFIRYIHLKEIDPQIKPGRIISIGDRIGVLGKEGESGGWSHLHFAIKAKQPSGEWGTVDGYAFLWQAYLKEYQPKVIAVARPHHLVATGEPVLLDGSKSWSVSGKIMSYEWLLGDETKLGPQLQRNYEQPGTYCEILKVTDDEGNFAYDFANVHVLDPTNPRKRPPTIHVAYAPTFGIKPGDLVTFKSRSFITTAGLTETWDFGDGSPKIQTQSDGNVDMRARDGYQVTTHRYEKPGDYIVTVETTNHHDLKATAHLHVHVEAIHE